MKRLAHAGLLVSTVLVLLAGFGLLWLITSNPSHFAGNLLASYLLLWGAFFLLSRRPRAEKMTRFLLASLSLFLVVALLEAPALARLVDYRLVFATPILAPWRNPQNLLDPELVHIRPPHQQLTGASRGGDIARLFHTPSPQLYRYNIRYDRDGFRNAVDLDAADIAVLGDSIIEGPNLSSAQLVTSVLARLQQARVANLGQTGYGPQQELVVLRRYAVPLRPRTVVWAFFEGNDLKNVHFYNEIRANWARYSAAAHSFVERSFTKNALQALHRLAGEPLPSGRPRSGLVRTADGQSIRMYFLYPGMPLSAKDVNALEQVRATLAAAHDLCASRGIRLIVAFIPTKFRVYHDLARFEPDSEVASWILNDLPDRLLALVAAVSREIGYLDLTPPLAEAARQGTLVHFPDDSHWSPEGHRVAAQAISDYIMRQR